MDPDVNPDATYPLEAVLVWEEASVWSTVGGRGNNMKMENRTGTLHSRSMWGCARESFGRRTVSKDPSDRRVGGGHCTQKALRQEDTPPSLSLSPPSPSLPRLMLFSCWRGQEIKEESDYCAPWIAGWCSRGRIGGGGGGNAWERFARILAQSMK